jgi:hypothetical protein
MESNSKIYTTTLFGLSSALTAHELANKNTSTIETAILDHGTIKMNNILPRVPSNQNIAKDK